MVACACTDVHKPRRVVLTGGPGAGKTALLELIRQSFCSHVKVLPEAAGVVFGGGFPREDDPICRRAAQRAIFYVQRELESAGDSHNPAIVLCDRGTIDGLAYWPGPAEEFWSSLGTTLQTELARYDAVIHLRTPPAEQGYQPESIENRECNRGGGYRRAHSAGLGATPATIRRGVVCQVSRQGPTCARSPSRRAARLLSTARGAVSPRP
jgi:predicted ATPase